MQDPTGADLAQFLTQAWRPEPPDSATDAAGLAALLPMLHRFGLGGLAWWCIRHQALGESEAALTLRQAFSRYALDDKLHEVQMERVVEGFRAAGIEPLLLKGWANARLYPSAGLRPRGDIDVLVQPHQYAAAQAVLARMASTVSLHIDLKGSFPALYERDTALVFERSVEVPFRQGSIRVLAPEEQLRLLCLHMLRHGGWRPLWLVDVAVLVETRAADFDWDRCLHGQTNKAQGVIYTVQLANTLLGADIDGLPPAFRAADMPRWLAPYILKLWEATSRHGLLLPTPIKAALRSPRDTARELRARWPDPISSAFTATSVPASRLGVFPQQVALMIRKMRRYAKDGPM